MPEAYEFMLFPDKILRWVVAANYNTAVAAGAHISTPKERATYALPGAAPIYPEWQPIAPIPPTPVEETKPYVSPEQVPSITPPIAPRIPEIPTEPIMGPTELGAAIDKFLEQAYNQGLMRLPGLNYLLMALSSLINIFGIAGAATSGTIAKDLMQRSEATGRLTMFEPGLLSEAWLRGIVGDADAVEQLARQGYSNERIKTMFQLMWQIPPIQDLVRFSVREVFNLDVRARYGQDEDFPREFEAWGKQKGLDPLWTRAYWAAHWQLPGVGSVFEMLHRRAKWPDGKVFDIEDAKTYLKVADYMKPFRDLLLQISYTPFTRVDVRRMWDLGVLTDDETISAYMDLGYEEKKARQLLVFTKLERRMPTLRSRYSKGWITAEQLQQELVDLGLTTTRARMVYETLVEADGEERVAAEKSLTKTEIIKGVSKGILSITQAVEFLTELGYSTDEAIYVLAIQTEVLSGSPETVEDYRQIMSKYRVARGQEPLKQRPELLEAERALKSARASLAQAKQEGKGKTEIDRLSLVLQDAEIAYRKVLTG